MSSFHCLKSNSCRTLLSLYFMHRCFVHQHKLHIKTQTNSWICNLSADLILLCGVMLIYSRLSSSRSSTSAFLSSFVVISPVVNDIPSSSKSSPSKYAYLQEHPQLAAASYISIYQFIANNIFITTNFTILVQMTKI